MSTGSHRERVAVERMAAGGDALGHLADGRVVFVEGALPGETVVADVHTLKRDFARARVAEVVEPSPHRMVPSCPELSRGCGGCGWQHIDPSAQLEWKAAVVAEALRRTGREPDASVVVGGAVDPWGYRTTMRLAVAPDGRVGLRSAHSHRIVPLRECPVAHPALSALLPAVRVRSADEVVLRVSAATGATTAYTPMVHGRIDGLPDRAAVGPDAVLHEVVDGVRLRVSAASFFQSGPQAASLLVATVRAACGDLLGDAGLGPVLDAYGGVGLFAAGLGLRDAVVVESSPSSCADARLNLPHAIVEETAFELWRPREVRLAIVDPARAGLGAEACDVLVATRAERIVLVSCDPVSLARDTALLRERGYAHRVTTVLDLFPHTSHVEAVTVFEPR